MCFVSHSIDLDTVGYLKYFKTRHCIVKHDFREFVWSSRFYSWPKQSKTKENKTLDNFACAKQGYILHLSNALMSEKFSSLSGHSDMLL